MPASLHVPLVVLGGGPGGYAAAFLAADLGMDVTLVEREERLGGTCLLRGCIPSKALLHVGRVLAETREMEAWGIHFLQPTIDVNVLRGRKEKVIATLSAGLAQLARRRKVSIVRGHARFTNSSTLEIEATGPAAASQTMTFDHCILASGSRPARIPAFDLPTQRVMDSTQALEMSDIPSSLLVIGGGYIGLEMGTVYAELGSKVSVVELTDTLLPGADRDLVKPLSQRLEKLFANIHLRTKVLKLEDRGHAILVHLEGPGEPMLAHRASHQGKVAVETLHGSAAIFAPRAIPAVVFTDPEIAWTGLTEQQAAAEGRVVEITRYPWAASGRAQALGRTEGLTKILVDPQTDAVLGFGIVGAGAGELIAEGTLAIEMGCSARDLSETIHPHPTLGETVAFAAENYYGLATEIYRPRSEATAP